MVGKKKSKINFEANSNSVTLDNCTFLNFQGTEEPQNYTYLLYTTATSLLRTTLTIAAASKKIFLRPHHDDDVRIPHFAAAVAVAAVVVHSKVLLIFRRLQKRRERKITYQTFFGVTFLQFFFIKLFALRILSTLYAYEIFFFA